MTGSETFRSNRGIDLAREFHDVRSVALATYLPTLGAIAALAAISLTTGIEMSYLTRDPSETLRVPFYIGLVSNVGILVWTASAAVCVFASVVLERSWGRSEHSAFLLASGLLTAWLALDDMLTLHDVVIPTYLFVPQKLFLLALGIVVVSYLLRFRAAILETDYPLLLLAFGFLALSVFVDGLQGRVAVPYHHYFEDGSKLLGIIGWAVYLTRTATQQLLSIARPAASLGGPVSMSATNTSAGKRVLMLLENNPYPQDGRVLREATALTEAGYGVTVIAPAAAGQARCEVMAGVRVYRFASPRSGDGVLGYAWEYAYSMAAAFVLSLIVFARSGFDVVHAHNPPDTFVFVGLFYKLFGVRFVFDHHDLSPEMYDARFRGRGRRVIARVLVWLEVLSCRVADHVIATNDSYKAVAMQRGGVPRERITVVRNGPDLDRVRCVDPDPSLRRRGQTIVGYVGVMGFQDGVDYLLRALHELAYRVGRTDFFCVLIGTGDAWPDLKALARELRLDEYVWFTGRVSDDELLRYLCAADICVDPDPSNPFNDRSTMIKMTEYMALEKPIVAFDLPEHRITAQDAAIYVRPNDALEFARALAALMDDPARRTAMGAYGRQRVDTALAWRYSVPNLLAAYRAVLPARVEPRSVHDTAAAREEVTL